MSGVFIPVNQLVYVLDDVIQSLQAHIDKFVTEREQASLD